MSRGKDSSDSEGNVIKGKVLRPQFDSTGNENPDPGKVSSGTLLRVVANKKARQNAIAVAHTDNVQKLQHMAKEGFIVAAGGYQRAVIEHALTVISDAVDIVVDSRHFPEGSKLLYRIRENPVHKPFIHGDPRRTVFGTVEFKNGNKHSFGNEHCLTFLVHGGVVAIYDKEKPGHNSHIIGDYGGHPKFTGVKDGEFFWDDTGPYRGTFNSNIAGLVTDNNFFQSFSRRVLHTCVFPYLSNSVFQAALQQEVLKRLRQDIAAIRSPAHRQMRQETNDGKLPHLKPSDNI